MGLLIKTGRSSQESTSKIMERETIQAVEEKQEKKYQWIKGERTTEVVQVASDQQDGKWLYFTDGTRINPNLINEFLMEVPLSASVGLQAPVTQVNPVSQPVITVENVPQVVVKEPSIMGKMIMKMSKKNVVNVPIQININIPTPQLYAMLSDGMEEDDLNEEIMAVVSEQIEINKLKEYINESVLKSIAEYYSNI